MEDGSTVLLQEIPKLLDGQTIQLEDGTTAFVHPNIKAGGKEKNNLFKFWSPASQLQKPKCQM